MLHTTLTPTFSVRTVIPHKNSPNFPNFSIYAHFCVVKLQSIHLRMDSIQLDDVSRFDAMSEGLADLLDACSIIERPNSNEDQNKKTKETGQFYHYFSISCINEI